MLDVAVYRYLPEEDTAPRMRYYEVPGEFGRRMVLDVLEHLKVGDPTLTYRRSCREGVCGSDGMNINGVNRLACITPVAEVLDARQTLVLRPLTGMPVIRDLVVDQTQFFEQYKRIHPYLINDEPEPPIERLQSPEERARLDGLNECILCGCCSSACPSYWWNPDKYVGPAGLLQAYRFLSDSRDKGLEQRLSELQDPFSVFRCHSIGNCTHVCPKGLNPMKAISDIKRLLIKHCS